MIKERNYALALLLILALVLTGCLGVGTPITTGPKEDTIGDVKVPVIPNSLTEKATAAALKTLNYDSSEWGERGSYTVIPQIAINYNLYIEKTINDLLNNMVAIDETQENLRIGRLMTSVNYEEVKHSVYDAKLTFTDVATDKIEAVFYRNTAGTRLNLVIRFRGDEREVRQIIYEDDGKEKHSIMLFYRREAITPNGVSDMNDIVEVWETGDVKEVKCVRVYGLSKPWEEKHILNFAAVSYNESLLPTTARLFQSNRTKPRELSEDTDSPAIFNERDKYVRAIDYAETPTGYPTVQAVTEVYEKGVSLEIVQEAFIDIETLESNLFDLVY